MKLLIIAIIAALLLVLTLPAAIPASDGQSDKSGESIDWQVISSGGQIDGSSTSYKLSSTIGQTAVGVGTTASYSVQHGFWQDFGGDFLCGDANSSGFVDIDDIVYLISYLFQGGPAPEPLEAGEVDCAGTIDIDDVVYLITYLFAGGPPPGDPNDDGIPDC